MKIGLSVISCLFFVLQTFGQEIQHMHSGTKALVENKGQWADKVLFQSKFNGGNIWIQQHGFLYDIRDYSRARRAHDFHQPDETNGVFEGVLAAAVFLNSNEVQQVIKEKAQPYYYNYFLGKEEHRWASDVHSYEEVTLKEFYPGVDLKVIDRPDAFKYELWCAPESDQSQIQIELKHFDQVMLAANGDLVLKTKLGDIIEKHPVAYQLLNGSLKEIACDFQLEGNILQFKLGKHNPAATVIIDPVLVFATYSGSPSDNFGMTATYGYDGTAYSGGTVFGNQYPTPDPNAFDITTPFTSTYNGVITTDVYISKYAADGSTMLWTAFLGGGTTTEGTETVHSLICDRMNNLYVFGITSSLDFPTVNAFQSTHGGGSTINVQFNGAYFGAAGTDIYISKISSNGHTLMSSTYVGGSENDGINYKLSSGSYNSVAAYDSLTTNYGDQFRGEIMIDSVGNCLVASCSRSANFPVLNAFQPNLAGQQDGVVFKLDNTLSNLMWSSYFGGTNNDACYSVKIDSSYNIVFAGGTSSTDLPGSTGGLNPSYLGGKTDGFVGKITANGQTLVQSTYIGANQYDQAFFVEINRNDEVFVLGQSIGGNFPVVNAQSYPNSSQFIAKLDPTLTSYVNAMTFGNGNPGINISPAAFLVDICGNIYVSGWGGNILGSTPLSGMPVSSNAFQSTPPNGFDFYLFVYKRDFSGLLYGSYMGGNQAEEHVDGGTSRFDKNGVVYQSVCGGCGGHSDFPTTPGSWSQINQNTGAGTNNNCNNIVFKFDFELLPHAEFTTNNLGGCAAYTVHLTNTSPSSDSYLWDFGNGDSTSTVYSPTVTYTNPGTYVVLLTVTDSVCLLTDTAQITIQVVPEIQLTVSNDTILCSSMPLTFTGNSQGTADYFIWSSDSNFSDTLNTDITDSVLNVSPVQTTTYYLTAGNQYCSKTDSVTVYFVGGSLTLSGNDSICIQDSTLLTASISIPNVQFSYSWSPTSILSTTSQPNQVYAFPTSSQWVYVAANGSNGCFDSDSIFITVGSISGTITASANPTVVVPGNSATLTAQPPGYSYQWTPVSGLSNPNGQITNATPTETTNYMVAVTDGICVKSATVKVDVLEIACDRTFVYIPNAFSPNGDLENDVLYVRSAVATAILFRIFDRWGELIFETRDQNIGWDGTFRGKLMDPDTYDYYLEATCVDGEEKVIKGNVTLLR